MMAACLEDDSNRVGYITYNSANDFLSGEVYYSSLYNYKCLGVLFNDATSDFKIVYSALQIASPYARTLFMLKTNSLYVYPITLTTGAATTLSLTNLDFERVIFTSMS